MPTVPVIPTFGTYGLNTLASGPETPLSRIIRTSRMIPLDLANPLVGMAGITTRAGRYVAGRQAACSLGSHPSGLDGRAVVPAPGRHPRRAPCSRFRRRAPVHGGPEGAFTAVSSGLASMTQPGPGPVPGRASPRASAAFRVAIASSPDSALFPEGAAQPGSAG